MENNVLSGFHIKSKEGEPLKLFPKKYTWHIPRDLRPLNIQPGDIVIVSKARTPFLVSEVRREKFEETGKGYKKIIALLERAPGKE
jgi:hypothetical protein